VVRSFTEPGIHASRPQRRVRYFWNDDGRAQLGAANATELAGYALGCKIAASLHPQAFGQVEVWTEAEAELAERGKELADALKAIAVSWGAGDVEVGEAGLVSFRRWPSVQVTSRDLGRRVLDAALAATAKRAA
jgi:hypothetical protein